MPGGVAVSLALVLAPLASPAARSPAAAAPCRAETIAPEKGARRDAFFAWLKSHAAALDGEVGERAAADDLDRFDLRIADIDNDGTEDYVLGQYVGSGGFLDLSVFRRAGEGWTLVRDSPLDQDAMVGANDYFDPVSDERQVLVRFCGRTLVTLLGGAGPNWSREAWLWKGGTLRRVCDADWLAEQRRQFQRLFDLKRYDAAHGFLDGVQASCRKQAAPQSWLWMQSDLALAAYHMGTYADCLDHVDAAQKSPQLAAASAALRRALRTNANLCRLARVEGPARAVDFSWLLELERDPARQVVLDPRFDRLLSAVVPDVKIAGEALRDTVKSNLYLPEPARVTDHRYVVLSGCRPHECENKGVAWIDTAAGKSVVAVNGLVSSTSFEGSEIPTAAWDAISDAVGFLGGEPLTFVGREGRIGQVQPPER